MQPASREQIVAIIRQRAERHREFVAGGDGAGEPRGIGPPPPPFMAPGFDLAGVGPLRAPAFYRQATVDEDESPRLLNVTFDSDVIAYQGTHNDKPGLFISGKGIRLDTNYFEIEILDKSSRSPGISIGLAGRRHPSDARLGWSFESLAYHLGEGALYKGRPRGQPFGPLCDVGDKVGCGIRLPPADQKFPVLPGVPGGPASNIPELTTAKVVVFFTRNGKEIGSQVFPLPPGGFFPAVSLQNAGEEVGIRQDLRWAPEEESIMLVDSGEDEWQRLHDIRLNGTVLEYVGRGKSLVDVGLAQARTPIGTRNHYFEIEIVDPGLNCYIAIGLARKDYPKNRHPGWNKGSIAYHADDGKVFVGSGVGSPFGPRCHKGDIMGCGVLFPRNYECKSDSEEELEQQGGVDQYGAEELDPDFGQLEYVSDSGEEEEWWNDRNYIQSGVKVQIYFTRNGKIIGKKEVRIPKGGFYPTVGMMSCEEKVRVDLRPLSG